MPSQRGSLNEALTRARAVARSSFDDATPHFDALSLALREFDATLAKTTRHYERLDDRTDADLKKAIAPLLLAKRDSIRVRFDDLRAAHVLRRRQLDAFTVMFFGKTMAGKSTTIEALVGGDGATIGVGEPDFTRDIRGCSWSGLLLVDTPGLLGFRKQLQGVAEGYVDAADVICMVVSDDSIEPTLFRRMRELRGQHKHLTVLLNVKSANRPILRRDPDEAFDEREVREMVEHIHKQVREAFPGDPVAVIPYCANAAFEAHRAATREEHDYLWRQSRIDDVINHLTRVVWKRGVPIRSTAAFSSLCHYSQDIAEVLEEDLPALRGQQLELGNKRAQAEQMFERVEREAAVELSGLKAHFLRVAAELDEFAWEYTRGERSEPIKESFRRLCRPRELAALQTAFQDQTLDRVRRNLTRFRDSLGEDLLATIRLADGEGPAEVRLKGIDLDAGSWKRKAGRAVRVAGGPLIGLATAAAIGSLAGPVGLLAGVLVGWAADKAAKSIGDTLEESGLKAQRKSQKRLREHLREHLWGHHLELNRNLLQWMKETVSSARLAVTRLLDEYLVAVDALVRSSESLVERLHATRHEVSRLSFAALLQETHPAFRDGRAVLVDATQWMRCRAKILVRSSDRRPITGLVIGPGGELIRALREHTGDPIDIVEAPGGAVTAATVRSALALNSLPTNAITVGDEVHVTATSKWQIDAIQGRQGRNLLLAGEILGCSICLHISPKKLNPHDEHALSANPRRSPPAPNRGGKHPRRGG